MNSSKPSPTAESARRCTLGSPRQQQSLLRRKKCLGRRPVVDRSRQPRDPLWPSDVTTSSTTEYNRGDDRERPWLSSVGSTDARSKQPASQRPGQLEWVVTTGACSVETIGMWSKLPLVETTEAVCLSRHRLRRPRAQPGQDRRTTVMTGSVVSTEVVSTRVVLDYDPSCNDRDN